MASPPEIPGDVILIESSDEQEFVKGRKRGRRTGAPRSAGSAGSARRSPASSSSSSSLSSVPSKKRQRRGSESPAAGDSSGSEEGEIGESGSSRPQTTESGRDGHGPEAQEGPRAAQPRAGRAPAQPKQAQQDPPSCSAARARQAQLPREAGAPQATAGLASGVFMPPNPPIWDSDSVSLRLPSLPQARAGSWPSRLKDWTHLLLQENPQDAASVTPSLVVAAWSHYLEQHSGLKQTKKKNARQAAKQAQESGTLAKQLAMARTAGIDIPQLSGASGPADAAKTNDADGPPPQADAPADAPANGVGVAAGEAARAPARVSDDEVALQQRYFPSADDASNVCLRCACEGHTSANCPNLHCRFCLDKDHWDCACPTRQRCGKCHQLGHASVDCVEKPKTTEGAGLACAYCSATDHLERHCLTAWRSFRPAPEAFIKVASVPVSCAICGEQGHYFSDCVMRRHPANPSYSLAKRDRYTDPNSGLLSIEAAAASAATKGPANGAPGPRPRGHAGRNTVIHYSESDDTDSEFLGNRLAKQQAPVGQMRMSSNIQMPARTANNAQGGGSQRDRAGFSGASRGQPGVTPAANTAVRGRGGFSMGMGGGSGRGGYHSVPPPSSMSNGRAQDESAGARGGRGGRAGRAGGGGGRGRGRGRTRAQ